MGKSILTTGGAALIAQKQANAQVLTIDQIVFADIPDLDTSVPPSADTVMPAVENIKLQTGIDDTGLVDNKTVVYSKILDASVGDFYINWIGLYSSADEVLIAVCHTPRHLKYASDGQLLGNTLCKNFALEINNVSDLTGITVSAETWQWDFSGLFASIDHNHDAAYEPKGAVDTHNNAANPHPGKFASPHDHPYEAAGAVSAHNAAANPHPQYTGYPDWSAGVGLAAATDYTASSNGWILIAVNKSGDGSVDCYMTINSSSVLIGRPGFYNTNTQPTMYLPIKAGDTYRYDIPAGTTLAVYKFYPNR